MIKPVILTNKIGSLQENTHSIVVDMGGGTVVSTFLSVL